MIRFRITTLVYPIYIKNACDKVILHAEKEENFVHKTGGHFIMAKNMDGTNKSENRYEQNSYENSNGQNKSGQNKSANKSTNKSTNKSANKTSDCHHEE